MTVILIPPGGTAPLQVNGYVRNGKVPDDQYAAGLAVGANQAAFLRGKQFFCGNGPVRSSTGSAIPTSAGTGPGTSRTRWRFYGHTSPLCTRIYAFFIMAQENRSPGDGQPLQNPYARLDLGGFGHADMHYGATMNPTPTADVPGQFAFGRVFIDGVTGDTDIQGSILEGDNGRVVSCTVFEAMLSPNTTNGYVPEIFASQAPILDTDRSALETLTTNQWKRGAAHCLSFSVDEDANKRTFGVTEANIIDGSTTLTASTPGYVLDFQNRSRYRNPNSVTGFVAAYGSCTSAGNGLVAIRDPAGTLRGGVSSFGTSPGWITGVVGFPSNVAAQKYDIRASTGAGTLSIYAVSVFELE